MNLIVILGIKNIISAGNVFEGVSSMETIRVRGLDAFESVVVGSSFHTHQVRSRP